MAKNKKNKKAQKNSNSQSKKQSNNIYFIPRETGQILNNLEKQKGGKFQYDNYSLLLNKFYKCQEDSKGKYEFDFNEMAKEYEFYPKAQNLEIKKLIDQINQRVKAVSQAYANIGYQVKKFELKTTSPMVIGLGNDSVLETSLTLHHTYGIPYIPASAIKGVARNWAINNIFDLNEGDKDRGALGDQSFCKIFGSPEDSVLGERQGKVIFLDAFPLCNIKVKTDIISSHYHNYYTSGKNNIPPADYLQPNIRKFLVLEEGALFKFYLMVKDKDNEKITLGSSEEYQGTILELTEKLLKEALTIEGIGAKSSVGYGLFG
ncbi:type III-B CRISPR module RAMP protein Cmr6 [Anaerobranca gottschalkii]|uniref:CRISPR-associated protein Cmr6 n=1 Tax=Anaerobranca gottschalkii DSM 13577 TaxID=1120990 RepID=A0A1I0C0R7_9FIRM|nr:type III-B CRISPR module RAMP protein Cmr6 [Anaerobranca gottschalkii]SET12983.1 CRISPR-associated protein Cmr6 [Anaerobranca gottschalkii DSM 13577]